MGVLDYGTDIRRVTVRVPPLLRSAMVGRFRFVNGSGEGLAADRALLGRGRTTRPSISILGQVSSFRASVGISGVLRFLLLGNAMVQGRDLRASQGVFQRANKVAASFVKRSLMVACYGPVLPAIQDHTFRRDVRLLSVAFHR